MEKNNSVNITSNYIEDDVDMIIMQIFSHRTPNNYEKLQRKFVLTHLQGTCVNNNEKNKEEEKNKKNIDCNEEIENINKNCEIVGAEEINPTDLLKLYHEPKILSSDTLTHPNCQNFNKENNYDKYTLQSLLNNSILLNGANNLEIVKLISEKISPIINKYFNYIFSLDDFKKLQDVYEQNFHDTINHALIKQNSKYCCKCHQKFCCKENKKENDNKLEVLIDFLPIISNFRNLYSDLTDSCEDFEFIFQQPLAYINKDNKINFLNLIKEEFIKCLFANKWLKNAITRVYNAFKCDNSGKNNIKKLMLFLKEIQMIIPSEMNKLKFLINEELNKSSKTVDELLSFINEENFNKFDKKKFKKSSKVKREEKLCFLDEIVEEFKRLLVVDSIHKNSIEKIIPILTQDWINSIKLV